MIKALTSRYTYLYCCVPSLRSFTIMSMEYIYADYAPRKSYIYREREELNYFNLFFFYFFLFSGNSLP